MPNQSDSIFGIYNPYSFASAFDTDTARERDLIRSRERFDPIAPRSCPWCGSPLIDHQCDNEFCNKPDYTSLENRISASRLADMAASMMGSTTSEVSARAQPDIDRMREANVRDGITRATQYAVYYSSSSSNLWHTVN